MESAKQQVRRLQMYLLINVGIVLLTTYMAWSRQITGFELAVFRLFNGLPNELLRLFLVITQAGSIWILFGLTLLLIGRRKSRLALHVFGVGSIALGVTEVMKQIVGRPRPGLLLEDVVIRDHLLNDFGFPSGHTAVATAIGLVMVSVVPRRWRWVCWLGIALVAISRLYLGVHAPLDVVGGFAVGVIIVTLSQLIKGKLKAVLKITKLKLQR